MVLLQSAVLTKSEIESCVGSFFLSSLLDVWCLDPVNVFSGLTLSLLSLVDWNGEQVSETGQATLLGKFLDGAKQQNVPAHHTSTHQ